MPRVWNYLLPPFVSFIPQTHHMSVKSWRVERVGGGGDLVGGARQHGRFYLGREATCKTQYVTWIFFLSKNSY